MDRANVDTDQIIPKQFLKRIERTGFGQFLFFDWRFQRRRLGQSRVRIEPPAISRREHSAGAAQLRLRLEPRARPLGAGRLRLPRRHRPQLRRHLLQQLLQERHAADPACRCQRRRLVRTLRQISRLQAHRRFGIVQADRRARPVAAHSKSKNFAAIACSTAWTTSA